MSRQVRSKDPYSIFKSFIALLLIVGCLWASQWQFQRGMDRSSRNSIIEEQILKPALPLTSASQNPIQFEWRTVEVSGKFDQSQQILLKNRYFQGVYGFEVLTRFKSIQGEEFWVDRGWVKAGKDALTAPRVSVINNDEVEIVARLRLNKSLPQGSFFALPSSGAGLIPKVNAQSDEAADRYYLDLLSGSKSELTPLAPAALPELSDGPHLAYSLQWIFFAGLIIYGRILIRRGQILTSKEL